MTFNDLWEYTLVLKIAPFWDSLLLFCLIHSGGVSEWHTMYILSSDLFEKLEIRVVCRKLLAFRYIFIVFFETNHMIIHICTLEILKTRV